MDNINFNDNSLKNGHCQICLLTTLSYTPDPTSSFIQFLRSYPIVVRTYPKNG